MRISDWSSDVCSSDLFGLGGGDRILHAGVVERLATLEADVLQQLRHGIEAVEHLAGRCAGLDDLAEDLQARDEAVAGGGVIRSEEHTSELQSLMRISYAVFCLKKKKR